MKILTGYVIREQVYPFLTGFIFFTFILVLNKLFVFADLVINKKVEFILVVKLFLFMLPSTVSLTIPMSVLISVIIAISRLSSDSELIALRSSGISLYFIIRPVVLSGLVIFIIMLFLGETLFVYCNKNYNEIFITILKSNPVSILEDRIFTTIGDKTIWVEDINRKNGRLKNIILYRQKSEGELDVIKSRWGYWGQNSDGSNTLNLYNGSILSSDIGKNSYSIVDFSKGSTEIMISDSKIDYNEETGKINPGELTSFELAGILLSRKISYKDDRDTALLWVEFYKKHAVPFSCLIFSLIGAPVGIFFKRGGRGVGFGISIIVFFVYYVFFMTGQSLAVKGLLNPFLGVWNANFIFLLVGLQLYAIKSKFETAGNFFNFINLTLRNIFNKIKKR